MNRAVWPSRKQISEYAKLAKEEGVVIEMVTDPASGERKVKICGVSEDAQEDPWANFEGGQDGKA